MITFILIITLITPQGNQVEVREEQTSKMVYKEACKEAKKTVAKAMRAKSNGYVLVTMKCEPAPVEVAP